MTKFLRTPSVHRGEFLSLVVMSVFNKFMDIAAIATKIEYTHGSSIGNSTYNGLFD